MSKNKNKKIGKTLEGGVGERRKRIKWEESKREEGRKKANRSKKEGN